MLHITNFCGIILVSLATYTSVFKLNISYRGHDSEKHRNSGFEVSEGLKKWECYATGPIKAKYSWAIESNCLPPDTWAIGSGPRVLDGGSVSFGSYGPGEWRGLIGSDGPGSWTEESGSFCPGEWRGMDPKKSRWLREVKWVRWIQRWNKRWIQLIYFLVENGTHFYINKGTKTAKMLRKLWFQIFSFLSFKV